jgi:polysaccharide pyruvyl transferase WcaK-like protein
MGNKIKQSFVISLGTFILSLIYFYIYLIYFTSGLDANKLQRKKIYFFSFI